MEEIKILEELFDPKIISILKLMFRDPKKQFYLQELSEQAKVSMATSSRILSKLSRLEIVRIQQIARFKLYSLAENKKVEFLSGLFKEDVRILEKFVELAKEIKGVNVIILHGKEAKDRANVLLIGDNIDAGDVKSVCAEVREKYNFTVSTLSLVPEQYEQMSQMGLYPGTKKMLWEK